MNGISQKCDTGERDFNLQSLEFQKVETSELDFLRSETCEPDLF